MLTFVCTSEFGAGEITLTSGDLLVLLELPQAVNVARVASATTMRIACVRRVVMCARSIFLLSLCVVAPHPISLLFESAKNDAGAHRRS